jgi:hypothetical protein
LSIDEKIQAAIEPLLTRIAALEADCSKFKEEIAALQNPAPKPTPKPGTSLSTQSTSQQNPSAPTLPREIAKNQSRDRTRTRKWWGRRRRPSPKERRPTNRRS